MHNQVQEQNKTVGNSLYSTTRTNDQDKEMLASRTLAMNKLKEVEDRIYQAKHRLKIMKLRSDKANVKSMHKSRVQNHKETIKEFSERKKQIKQEYFNRRLQETDNYHDKISGERSKHKQKIKQNKQLMQTKNQWIYETIRKQKQRNLELIKKAKAIQQEQKKRNRDRMIEKEKKRSEYIKQFAEGKRNSARRTTQNDIKSLQSKISDREKLLQLLQKQEQEMATNPQTL